MTTVDSHTKTPTNHLASIAAAVVAEEAVAVEVAVAVEADLAAAEEAAASVEVAAEAAAEHGVLQRNLAETTDG